MIYKPFGNTGISLSALGFGAMRLPMASESRVDDEKAIPLMQKAFELGVNYIDTAPYYCGKDSERAVGLALKGWRDTVYLSTKNPATDSKDGKWRKNLETSLKNLDTEYIDFYHFWGIDLESFEEMRKPGGPVDDAWKALEEGLIKHLCFSFHDKEAANMKPIIDSGLFTSVLCQYNLLDRANEDNIAYAKQHGLGVIIMGPVGGGRLGAPSAAVQALLQNKVASSAEMALRFVLANPNVNMALSGMQNEQMLEENVKVASIGGLLSEEERNQVSAMLDENKRLMDLYCTGCNYCMPCPQKLNIPHLFRLMNYHKVYKLTDYAKAEYQKTTIPLDDRKADWEKSSGVDVSQCIECGACEAKCPQKLEIIKQLKETQKALG
ncbi:MAG TPA: aldo/keto reductase [Candidatus Limiplasma sp.]|nr:aldo/keto reductase [Candidatus Limiplasma sp.]HRX08738.1 aldo/keto reductase [Candidatus Limiplasma sp.]